MTCKDCLSYKVCFVIHTAGEFQENAEVCQNFKNKTDFVEVVRCKKCKEEFAMKRWLVKCQVNMDASNEVSVIVKANTERKAKIKAENECCSKGYFNVSILSCVELT